jgi:L-rhamnose mutarotase
MTLCLQDDLEKIEEYKRYHESVWPEVLAQIRAIGIQRMQIFLRGRRMFMYIDTDDDFDLRSAWARRMKDPKSVEWDQFMATLQERAPEATPDEWWAEMERVFDTDWPQHLPT